MTMAELIIIRTAECFHKRKLQKYWVIMKNGMSIMIGGDLNTDLRVHLTTVVRSEIQGRSGSRSRVHHDPTCTK